MADIMNYMVGGADIGEELTSFLSDDDDDEIDMEDDENMYMLYDDEPPSYDVVARLKEVNDALQKEIIPPDYEDRNRKVTFQDNPVYLEIYCFNGYSDEDDDDCDDNEKNVDDDDDDDGYGDSTEASEELAEDNSTEPEPTENVSNETLETASLKENLYVDECNEKYVSENVIEISNNNDAQFGECKYEDPSSDLPAPAIAELVLEPVKPESPIAELVLEAVKAEIPPVLELEPAVIISQVEDSVSSNNVPEKTEINLPKDEVIAVNGNHRPKSSKVNASSRSKSKSKEIVTSANNNTDKVPNKKPVNIRPRSSSVPPRGSTKTEEVSMIMTSKGKFHMMTTDDIQVRKRTTSSAPSRASRSTETRRSNLSDITRSTTVNGNNKTVPKIDSKTCKLNTRVYRPFTTEAKTKNSVPDKLAIAVIGRPTTIMPKYQGEGPSRYGLTAEQKKEKKLHTRSLNQNLQEKKQETILEQKRKKEQVNEAYRLWLQRKKNQNFNGVKLNEDFKNESGNNSSEQLNAKTRPSFEDWMLMKRRQKRNDEEIERMKSKVEMQISYVKTAEQHRLNFNKWSNQKKRQVQKKIVNGKDETCES